MEALTRLVNDSLARHGLDRPVDPRRLQWSRWVLCDSPRSLLVVPSKPGIFAIAEEVCGVADEFVRPGNYEARDRESKDWENKGWESKGWESKDRVSKDWESKDRKGHDFSRAAKAGHGYTALAAKVSFKRMLAVLQFSEDDNMAFILDRMFTRVNPMRERLSSGKCFLRFVAIEDQEQRRSICTVLNQWLLSSAEKASGIPAGFYEDFGWRSA